MSCYESDNNRLSPTHAQNTLMLGWAGADPARDATADANLDNRSLLDARTLLPTCFPIGIDVVVRPHSRAGTSTHDVLLLLLFPRSLLSGLLLRLPFFPSNLNTGQVLAVLVPEDVARSI